MKESVRLGKIAGVAVGINWSLLLIAGLIALGLGNGRFPADAPGYTRTAYLAAGAVTALLFLAGVLIHEISHAMVAKREGLPVDGIVLWFMGGYTRIGSDPQTPGAEARVSGVGPLASLVLGLVLLGGSFVGHSAGVSPLAVSMLRWLATINILLAVFNVLPGAPLDGGRILHAAVWRWTRDRWRASRVASRAGRVLGAVIIAIGLVSVLRGRGSFNGIWLSVVGWFLILASRMEENSASLLHDLEGLRACDVMARPAVVPGWLTIDGFYRTYGLGGPVWLLEQWGGGVVALITPAALQAVPPDQWAHVRALDIAVGLEGLPLAPPLTPASAVLRRMAEREATWILVVDGGHIVGVINEQMLTGAAARMHSPSAASASAGAATPVG
jgi:Zn-dependent protease